MTTQKNKGVLLFAKNNKDFNYIKQAKVSATLAKHYLNVPVALVTPVDELDENVDLFVHIVIKHVIFMTIYKDRNFLVNQLQVDDT